MSTRSRGLEKRSLPVHTYQFHSGDDLPPGRRTCASRGRSRAPDFCFSRERENKKVEVEKREEQEKGDEEKKKEKEATSQVLLPKTSMLGSTSLFLLFAPRRASREFSSTRTTPRMREGDRITHGEPAPERGKDEFSLSSPIHRVAEPTTRKGKEVARFPALSASFARIRPRKEKEALSFFPSREKKKKHCEESPSKSRKKGRASPFFFFTHPTLSFLLSSSPNSRVPLPSPRRSCGGRGRASWPRGGASTRAWRGFAFAARGERDERRK